MFEQKEVTNNCTSIIPELHHDRKIVSIPSQVSLGTIHILHQQTGGGGWGQKKMVNFADFKYCLCWHRWVGGWALKRPKICWRSIWMVPWSTSMGNLISALHWRQPGRLATALLKKFYWLPNDLKINAYFFVGHVKCRYLTVSVEYLLNEMLLCP